MADREANEVTGDSFVRHSKGADIINGIHTDIVCTEFADRLFIVLSQYEKLGTLIHVTRDTSLDGSEGNATYSTKTLIGEDAVEIDSIARNLASHVNSSKPILFALALRDKSPSTLKSLVNLVDIHRCWT